MATEPSRVLVLRIDPSGEPISGTLADESGANREFRGWLGLARAIEILTGPGAPAGADAPARGSDPGRDPLHD